MENHLILALRLFLLYVSDIYKCYMIAELFKMVSDVKALNFKVK